MGDAADMPQLKSSLRGAPLKVTAFTKAVMKMVAKIPHGKVATYGQIARLAGKPGGARGVGWILNSSSENHELPWHRVINSQGAISFPPKSAEFLKQKSLLKKEGVEFLSAKRTEKKLDLGIYQWKKDLKDSASRRVSTKTPNMFR